MAVTYLKTYIAVLMLLFLFGCSNPQKSDSKTTFYYTGSHYYSLAQYDSVCAPNEKPVAVEFALPSMDSNWYKYHLIHGVAFDFFSETQWYAAQPRELVIDTVITELNPITLSLESRQRRYKRWLSSNTICVSNDVSQSGAWLFARLFNDQHHLKGCTSLRFNPSSVDWEQYRYAPKEQWQAQQSPNMPLARNDEFFSNQLAIMHPGPYAFAYVPNCKLSSPRQVILRIYYDIAACLPQEQPSQQFSLSYAVQNDSVFAPIILASDQGTQNHFSISITPPEFITNTPERDSLFYIYIKRTWADTLKHTEQQEIDTLLVFDVNAKFAPNVSPILTDAKQKFGIPAALLFLTENSMVQSPYLSDFYSAARQCSTNIAQYAF
jgi:hypothetical protein